MRVHAQVRDPMPRWTKPEPTIWRPLGSQCPLRHGGGQSNGHILASVWYGISSPPYTRAKGRIIAFRDAPIFSPQRQIYF